MTGPPVRGYGYRIRDDRRPPLGIQPDPLKQTRPGDVADAAARALLPDGTTSTASLTQASSGLIFRDRFDRADGALGADWTTINGTWAIAGNLARGSPAATTAENVVASVLAAAAERVVQAYMRASATTATAALRARWDSGTEAAGNGYLLELVPGVGFNLIKHVAGAYTTLVAYAQATLAAAVLYGMKLHVKNGSQKAYADGRAIAAATDATHDALNGKAGLRSKNTSGAAGPTVDADDFAVYLSNTVTVNGLPVGYQVRINGTLYASAGGTASCDLAGAMCPLQAIEVLDGNNNVVATLVPATGIWGGDVYTFTPVTVPSSLTVQPLSDTALRASWAAIADATAYRVEYHTGNAVWVALPDVAAGTLRVDLTGLTEGVTRYFRVTALRDGALGAPSGTVSGTTLLSAPNNLAITSAAAGGVNLSWTDRSALEVNYQLQRSTDGSAFVDVGIPLAANSSSTIDTTPTNGHSYAYRVATIAVDGARAYSNEASCTLSLGSGGIARTATGFLFRDDFTRVDQIGIGSTDWNVSGSVQIVGNKLQINANAFVTVVPASMGGARTRMHVQTRAARLGSLSFFSTLWARFIDASNYFQYDHRTNNAAPQMYRRTAGAFTQVGGNGTFVSGAANQFDTMALSTLGSAISAYTNGVLQCSGTDANNNVNGTAGFQNSSGGNLQIDEFIVCSDRVITCTNLPAGWKIRLGGAGGALSGASPGGGAAVTLDPAGAIMPFAQIDVIDAGGVLQQSFTPAGGLWGGDALDWTGAVAVSLQTVPVGLGPPGVFDGVTVGITPYYVGTLFTGQSVINSKPNVAGGRADTSASLPIDITFNADVGSVTVKLYDPTYAGNYLIAYNAAGVELGRVAYATSSSSVGVDATVIYAGIRKVTISPAAGDFIAILDVKFKH